MTLLPVRTVRLCSSLLPAEIGALLLAAVGDGAGAAFAGTVSTDSFFISQINEFRSSHLPTIRGRLAPAPGGGTRVDLLLLPRPVVAVFMAIWLGFLAAVTAVILAAHATGAGRSPWLALAPVALAALTWLLMAAVFAADARWALERLLAAVPGLGPAAGAGRAPAREPVHRAEHL